VPGAKVFRQMRNHAQNHDENRNRHQNQDHALDVVQDRDPFGEKEEIGLSRKTGRVRQGQQDIDHRSEARRGDRDRDTDRRTVVEPGVNDHVINRRVTKIDPFDRDRENGVYRGNGPIRGDDPNLGSGPNLESDPSHRVKNQKINLMKKRRKN